MTERTVRRRPDADPERREDEPRAPEAPPGAASILALQRSAGNAAVSRMLARQPADAPVMVDIFGKPNLNLGAGTQVNQVPLEVQKVCDAYLVRHVETYIGKVRAGTTSVPEVVADLRQNVQEAATISAALLAGLVRMHRLPAGLTIPEERKKVDAAGLTKQAEASIANALPSVPSSVTLRSDAGSLTLTVSGAKLKTQVGGAKVSVDAGKEGASAEVKKGDVSVGASGKWDGSEFGVKTQVKDAKLDGKVSRDPAKGWSWSVSLTMPLWGEEIDVVPDLQKVVAEAQGAIGEAVGFIQDGGDPKDSFVTERLGKIKPAIDAAQRAAQKSKGPAATLRANVGGGADGLSAGVTLTIEF